MFAVLAMSALATFTLATFTLAGAAYPTYESRVYNQTLDHFDPTSQAKWRHRYLFQSSEWGVDPAKKLENGCPGPILLYTGNEGPITAFWGSNGFMVEHLAPKWGAMLIFPEEVRVPMHPE
jgi:hypothetical protein